MRLLGLTEKVTLDKDMKEDEGECAGFRERASQEKETACIKGLDHRLPKGYE